MKIHKSIILKIGFYSLLVITLLNLTYFFYEYKVLTLMKNIVTQKMTKTDETSGYILSEQLSSTHFIALTIKPFYQEKI